MSTGPVTMGVEEEFLLVEPRRARPVPLAGEVLAALDEAGLPEGGKVGPELRASQVEVSTGICRDGIALREQVRRGRAAVSRAACEVGVLVVPVGTPPLLGGTGDTAAVERYARIDQAYESLALAYQACGLHVHVGVADRDTAVAVVNHVGRWLPTLLALSVNSPFHGGHDSGYGSWRVVQQSRFPSYGLPPQVADYREHQAEIDRLMDCGVLVDEFQTFWVARPSARYPTVEIRVADTALDVDAAMLQALLTRALVSTAVADLDRGREAVPVPPVLAEAALWSASRHGLSGPGIDLATATRTPAAYLVRDLVDHCAHALEDSGDLAEVRRLLFSHNTGACRQRELAAALGVAVMTRRVALTASIR